MTQSEHPIPAIPGLKFQIYPFSSSEIKDNEDFFISMLNKGYNVPRFQYNIITTPRIKHSLVEDLCITPSESCYAILCFVEDTKNINDYEYEIELDESAEISRNKLLKMNPEIDFNNFKIEIDSSNEEIKLPNNFKNKFLGMSCLKPHSSNPLKSVELTGFVSFYPKIGSKLIEITEFFATNHSKNDKIWITAIKEHNLKSMYEKWGYQHLECVLVPLSRDGAVEDTHLENDIGASQDFHLDVLSKAL